MFAAGAVMSSLPIIILFVSLQKYITNGLTGGAVKG
jgi:arabinogalactan oligomer/maltooligosaccharide transport system permease protein